MKIEIGDIVIFKDQPDYTKQVSILLGGLVVELSSDKVGLQRGERYEAFIFYKLDEVRKLLPTDIPFGGIKIL